MDNDRKVTISVIVPVYNVEPYIRECVDSLLKNDIELQLILVDDGSTDNSGVICDEYAKEHDSIVVIHKENGGLSSARNAGLDAATGEYIGFVDGDDLVSPDMFSYMLQTSVKEKADITVCGILFFYHNDIRQNAVCVHLDKGAFDGTEAIGYLLEPGGFGDYAVNKLYKRELFDGIRYPEGKLYEDVYTTYKAFDKAKTVAVTDRDFYYYRYNSDGLSHSKNFNRNALNYVYASLEQLEFMREHHMELVVFAVNKCLNACVLLYKYFIAHYRDLVFDPDRSAIKNIIKDILEKENCAKCSEELMKEAQLIVNKTFLWQYDYHLKMISEKLHNHPGMQRIIEKLIIKY